MRFPVQWVRVGEVGLRVEGTIVAIDLAGNTSPGVPFAGVTPELPPDYRFENGCAATPPSAWAALLIAALLLSRRRAALVALAILGGCSSAEAPPTTGLPFVFERPAKGEPLTATEVDAFTGELNALWHEAKYFEWAADVSHGVDASTGKPDYLLWWHDVEVVKAGDTVTFRHSNTGGGHNIYIPSSHVLGAAAAGYLFTGDAAMGRLAAQYAKGIDAACRGFVFDANDTNTHLMARNVVGSNHGYSLADGRKAAVDYTPWFTAYQEWNAQRFQYANNPDWGDVWVTNMRSKDDVPHIYMAALILERLAIDAPDAAIKAAAQKGLDCVHGFTKDIVDSGYVIRTKDPAGQAYTPTEDLASFVQYESIDPKGECAAKLTSALLGTDDPRGNDCGRNAITGYESYAVALHFYNYHIVQTFHLTAALASLTRGQNDAAQTLLAGVAERATRYLTPGAELGQEDERWGAEISFWLVQAAAVGLPLTAEEVRFVHTNYRRALVAHRAWGRWNIWEQPDGTYSPDGGFLPSSRDGLIPAEDLGVFMHYCWSPYRNASGQPLVDCEKIRAAW